MLHVFRQLNNARALEQAKNNVKRHFSVVGVLELLNCTLDVAERKIGTFFGGVQQMYFNELLGNKTNIEVTFCPVRKEAFIFIRTKNE